jgi:hypothetical protein
VKSEKWGSDFSMAYVAALLFLVGAIAAIVLLWQTHAPIVVRALGSFVALAFVVLSFLTTDVSRLSPFGSTGQIPFGGAEDARPIIIGIIGAVLGVLGSCLTYTVLVKPLCTIPLVLIPTIKLITAANDGTILSLLLLFALSYQNGFFWERLLRQPEA